MPVLFFALNPNSQECMYYGRPDCTAPRSPVGLRARFYLAALIRAPTWSDNLTMIVTLDAKRRLTVTPPLHRPLPAIISTRASTRKRMR